MSEGVALTYDRARGERQNFRAGPSALLHATRLLQAVKQHGHALRLGRQSCEVGGFCRGVIVVPHQPDAIDDRGYFSATNETSAAPARSGLTAVTAPKPRSRLTWSYIASSCVFPGVGAMGG